MKVGGYSGGNDSPAKKAGLEPGDIIVKADGRMADRVSTLQRIIRSHEPGETVDIEVFRYGQSKTFKVKLAEAPNPTAQVASAELMTTPQRRVRAAPKRRSLVSPSNQ